MFTQQLQPLKYIDLILSHTFRPERKLKGKSANQWVWLKDLCFNYAFSSLALMSVNLLWRDVIVLGLLNADQTSWLEGAGWAEVLLLAWFTHIPLGVVYYHHSLSKKKNRLSVPLFKHFQCHQHGQCEWAVALNSLNDHKHFEQLWPIFTQTFC